MSIQLDNSNYQNFFDKIHFNVDVPFNNSIKPPFENRSFFLIVCGESGSGKTSFLINLLKQHKNPKNNIYYKVFDKILLVMPPNSRASINNSIFETLPPDQIFDDIDEHIIDYITAIKEMFDENKEEAKLKKKKYKTQHQLLIIDDATAEMKNEATIKMFETLSMNRRHFNLSIIILTQIWNKVPRSIRGNATSFVIFTRCPDQLDDIRKEGVAIRKKKFERLIEYCFDEEHNFIFIDKRKNTFYKNLQKIKFPD